MKLIKNDPTFTTKNVIKEQANRNIRLNWLLARDCKDTTPVSSFGSLKGTKFIFDKSILPVTALGGHQVVPSGQYTMSDNQKMTSFSPIGVFLKN